MNLGGAVSTKLYGHLSKMDAVLMVPARIQFKFIDPFFSLLRRTEML